MDKSWTGLLYGVWAVVFCCIFARCLVLGLGRHLFDGIFAYKIGLCGMMIDEGMCMIGGLREGSIYSERNATALPMAAFLLWSVG